jgi:hypothetical protein
VETAIIKKRLNTFRHASGRLQGVSADVVMEVLRAWESWPGQSSEFYREVGLKKHQLSTLIREGKKLVKSGKVTESEFKELSLPGLSAGGPGFDGMGMELKLDANRAIRFGQVDQLVEFLKKTGA